MGACFVPAVCPERTGNSPSSPQDMQACRLSIRQGSVTESSVVLFGISHQVRCQITAPDITYTELELGSSAALQLRL